MEKLPCLITIFQHLKFIFNWVEMLKGQCSCERTLPLCVGQRDVIAICIFMIPPF